MAAKRRPTGEDVRIIFAAQSAIITAKSTPPKGDKITIKITMDWEDYIALHHLPLEEWDVDYSQDGVAA